MGVGCITLKKWERRQFDRAVEAIEDNVFNLNGICIGVDLLQLALKHCGYEKGNVKGVSDKVWYKNTVEDPSGYVARLGATHPDGKHFTFTINAMGAPIVNDISLD